MSEEKRKDVAVEGGEVAKANAVRRYTWFSREEVSEFLDKGIQWPICPFCRDAMLRVHIEHHDGSGWMHCWQCDCEGSDAPVRVVGNEVLR